MKIVLLESLAISQEALAQHAKKLTDEEHEFVSYNDRGTVAEQQTRVKDADILMIANMPLPKEVICASDNLKFIDVAFTGVDHVDLEAAKAKNIAVSNASGYANQSVAELVLGMMLCLLRNVMQVDNCCRNEKTKDGLVGCELRGKTVGVIGTGAIGLRTAELCHLMGCNIVACDPYPNKNAPDYITYLTLDELLKTADIVTLHCPLIDETRLLMNGDRIRTMKKGSYLINAARGAVVDSAALADALNSGHLAGAGIDVFETEPPINSDHVLLHAKNTILTPHIAFASKESMELRADIVFNNIQKWLSNSQINKIL